MGLQDLVFCRSPKKAQVACLKSVDVGGSTSSLHGDRGYTLK